MAHFALTVICEDINDIGEILKSYFQDIEVPRYINMTRDDVIMHARAKHQYLKREYYDKYISDPVTFEREHVVKFNGRNFVRYLKNKFMKEYQMSDEELIRHLKKDYGRAMDKEGNVWSTLNPWGMFDGYCIGGNYRDFIVTKNGRCDYAQIKDIQFSKMKDEDGSPFYTYALIPFGQKMEAMDEHVNSDKEQERTDKLNWMARYRECIKKANPEHYLVIIDCHT